MASLVLVVEVQSWLHLQGSFKTETADSTKSSGNLYETEQQHSPENNEFL
jgi:hypothetical protein